MAMTIIHAATRCHPGDLTPVGLSSTALSSIENITSFNTASAQDTRELNLKESRIGSTKASGRKRLRKTPWQQSKSKCQTNTNDNGKAWRINHRHSW